MELGFIRDNFLAKAIHYPFQPLSLLLYARETQRLTFRAAQAVSYVHRTPPALTSYEA